MLSGAGTLHGEETAVLNRFASSWDFKRTLAKMPGRMLAAQCLQTSEQPLRDQSKVEDLESEELASMRRYIRMTSMSSPGSSAVFDVGGMGVKWEAISGSEVMYDV